MRILGIDPGLAIVGWAIIETHRGNSRPIAFGAIRTPAHTLIESRLKIIEDDLNTIIDKYINGLYYERKIYNFRGMRGRWKV